MVLLISIAVIILILIIAHSGNSGDVKVYFKDVESGNTRFVGKGNSVGSAMIDSCKKIYQSISPNSREETIRNRLNDMQNALSEHQNKIDRTDLATCYEYVEKLETQLRTLERKREEKQKAVDAAKA